MKYNNALHDLHGYPSQQLGDTFHLNLLGLLHNMYFRLGQMPKNILKTLKICNIQYLFWRDILICPNVVIFFSTGKIISRSGPEMHNHIKDSILTQER